MKFYSEMLASCLVLGLVSFSGPFAFQDHDEDVIEIVDQDGEPVDAVQWRIGGKQGAVKGNVNVQVDDGKIIIVDQDGKKREIDVSGARNIIVNKSVQSIIEDGEEKRQVMGKAIIIGPDGERQEIELGDGVDGFATFGFGKGPGESIFEFLPHGKGKAGKVFFAPSAAHGSEYMIGVHCKPVASELRSHLELEDGIGLVVSMEPNDDTPAGKAGIQQHDILIYADQQDLSSNEDLVEVVQKAGKEDRAMSITLVRKGKELGMDVKPTKRNSIEKRFTKLFPGGELDLRVEHVGPGFVFDADQTESPADLIKRVEQMNERMQQQMEEMARLQEELQKSFQRANKSGDGDE